MSKHLESKKILVYMDDMFIYQDNHYILDKINPEIDDELVSLLGKIGRY